MNFPLTRWAIAQKAGGPGPKFVLFLLADHSDAYGECLMTPAALAEEGELDEAEVARILDGLQAQGLIARIPLDGRSVVVVLADSICVAHAAQALVFVARGSTAWQAWESAFAAESRDMPQACFLEGLLRPGAFFASMFPPSGASPRGAYAKGSPVHTEDAQS